MARRVKKVPFIIVCDILERLSNRKVVVMSHDLADELPSSREDLLRTAADRTNSAPLQLTIRKLLNYWGARRRGYLITEEIKRDLAAAKLVTHPSFTEGWIDSSIELIPITATAQSDEQAPVTRESTGSTAQVSLRVVSLASANTKVEFVRPDDTLERAQTLMICNDYSQLAVQSGSRDLRGAISWESIAQAKIRKSDAGLRDAIVQPEVVNLHDDLLARIPMIVEAGFVFVQAKDKQICGVVTTSDLSLEFAALAKPFFLLAEVERRLRRVIDRTFTAEEIAALVDPADVERSAASASDLTIGEAARLLENPNNWTRLGWILDRSIFIKQLHDIRQIRNEVMHFSPDPLDEDQIHRIELFLRSLRKLDPQRD
jgi:restriction system protein